MAVSKKKKKFWLIVIGAIVAIYMVMTRRAQLAGTWNGMTWDAIQNEYKGISLALFSNDVTVSSRPDMGVGKLVGNTITWPNGNTWTRS